MESTPTPTPKQGMATWKIIALVLVAVLVYNAVSKRLRPDAPSTSQESAVVPMSQAEAAAVVAESEKATKAEYDQLKTGMSYEEAALILGSDGEELSSNELGGYKTVMYKWKGNGLGANMNATFQNDKLVSKAQMGLQ